MTAGKGNLPGLGGGPLTLDLSTDRLVIWTVAQQQPDINAPLAQDQSQPLEIYMEGNVVFRQGERKIYAERMYYDVRNHVGTVLGADMLTPAPGYEGKVRLHADILQQIGAGPLPRPRRASSLPAAWEFPATACRWARPRSTTVQTPRVDRLGEPAAGPQDRPAGGRSPGVGCGAEQLAVHRGACRSSIGRRSPRT